MFKDSITGATVQTHKKWQSLFQIIYNFNRKRKKKTVKNRNCFLIPEVAIAASSSAKDETVCAKYGADSSMKCSSSPSYTISLIENWLLTCNCVFEPKRVKESRKQPASCCPITALGWMGQPELELIEITHCPPKSVSKKQKIWDWGWKICQLYPILINPLQTSRAADAVGIRHRSKVLQYCPHQPRFRNRVVWWWRRVGSLKSAAEMQFPSQLTLFYFDLM